MATKYYDIAPTPAEPDGCSIDSMSTDTSSNNENEEGLLYLSGCSPGHSVVPECEFILDWEAGVNSAFTDCGKNPGHTEFIPVKDFTAENLPIEMRTEDTMSKMRQRIDTTVLIRAKHTSKDRPDEFHDSGSPYPYCQYKGKTMPRMPRYGTGTLSNVNRYKPVDAVCPCHECKKSDNPQQRYWKFNVITATHVIFDTSEAEKAEFWCFHDSDENKDDVVMLYGVKVKRLISSGDRSRSDSCDTVICVTHDEASADKIKSRCHSSDEPSMSPIGGIASNKEIIVSHPHGCSKRVTIGDILYITFPVAPKYEIGKPQMFLENTTYISETSGTSTLLPAGTTFTLPDGAEYAMRYHYDKYGFTFPPGTKFNSADEEAAIPIPENVIFQCNDEFFSDYQSYYRMTYNIPTCPGTSGALLVCRWLNWGNVYRSIPHSGTSGGKNQTGMALHTTPSLYYYDPTPTSLSLYQKFLKCMNWASCCVPWRTSVPFSSTSTASIRSAASSSSIPTLYY